MKEQTSSIVFMKRLILLLICLLLVLVCTRIVIDKKRYTALAGNYQQISGSTEDTFHLYIGVHGTEKRFFTIYDNQGVLGGKETPWIVGKITELDQQTILVEVDTEVFASIPSDWTLKNGTLTLHYEISDDRISFINNDHELLFQKQNLAVN